MQDEKQEKSKTAECNICKVAFKISLISKPMSNDFIDIGIECPNKHFFHSYYDHPKLEKRRLKLEEIQAGIGKSLQHYEKFIKTKERYRQYFDKMQIDGTSTSRR